MKMKTWLITLPFLCLAGGAMAQDSAPEAVSAPTDMAASPAKAEAPDAAPAKPKMRKRQGGDIRSCLDKTDDKAIIRCAEKGRKPIYKHARKHAPAPETKPAPAPDSMPVPKP